jgi:membrane-bound metal-dependent hydrolase YbcI (DUF457 family)
MLPYLVAVAAGLIWLLATNYSESALRWRAISVLTSFVIGVIAWMMMVHAMEALYG